MKKKLTKKALFLELAKPDKTDLSRPVYLKEFKGRYQPLFYRNGNPWARSLKEFEVYIHKEKNKTQYIQLRGLKDHSYNQSVKSSIKKKVLSKSCVVLNTKYNLECDHRDRLKSPMIYKDTSLSECLKCLDILEANKDLYFGKRETTLQKAKQAFCEDIDDFEFELVKDFMDKFSSIIDEKTEEGVIDEAIQTIDKWYDDAPFSNSEEIRNIADSIEELENNFGIDNEKNVELYERAEELDREDDFLNHQNIKKEDTISDDKLDEMFNKL